MSDNELQVVPEAEEAQEAQVAEGAREIPERIIFNNQPHELEPYENETEFFGDLQKLCDKFQGMVSELGEKNNIPITSQVILRVLPKE